MDRLYKCVDSFIRKGIVTAVVGRPPTYKHHVRIAT